MRTIQIDYRKLRGKSGIYALINYETKKVYVGRTKDLEKRKQTHFWELRNNRHGNKHLQHAYNLNPDAFGFRVLDFCDESELNEREIYFIDLLNSMEQGYNLCEGGKTTNGYHFTDEQKAKISKANKGKKVSQEVIQRRKETLKRRFAEDPEFAKAFKEKAKKNLTGNAWNKGRPCSEETKRKLSEAQKGIPKMSEEHKKKLSLLFRGENAIGAKLTESEVIDMRLRFLRGEKRLDIAKDYPHVSPNHVFDIVKGKRWIYVPNTIEELERIKHGRKKSKL